MKSKFLLFAGFIVILSCAVQKTSSPDTAILLTINGEPVIADEFIYVYEKNNFNNDSIYHPSDVDAYFDLFLKFKLKVQAAKVAGIDTSQAFLAEFNTYKNQLIRPYLAESKEQDKLVREAYAHMQYEVDASHILISLNENAAPDDTLLAYQKISDILYKAKNGEDFGSLAEQYSEDPSAKSNQGHLGYFTVFQMVYAFEEAAYNTPVDSVSGILRSRFGYHILKVHDKRPYSGMVKVSHIMVTNQNGVLDEQKMKNKIFEIHDLILRGGDWNDLCIKYSDDMRTKNNGGTLPFIGLRQINDDAFEQAAFGLNNPGQISDPVRSRFGWHIIKLEEKQGLKSFEEMEDELRQKVSKDERAMLGRKAVINKLKEENNFSQDDDGRQLLLDLADDNLLKGKWAPNFPDSIAERSVFSIGTKHHSIGEAKIYITNSHKPRSGSTPENYMNELIEQYIEEKLLEQEEQQLVAGNRDFRMLLNEYYEGILLFEIMNKNVWAKATEDTSGLRTFFNEHQENYQWKPRVRATVFRSSQKEMIDSVRMELDRSPYQIMESTLVPGQSVVEQGELDVLIRYFRIYSQSFFTIRCPENQIKTTENQKDAYIGQMAELMKYLTDFGINEEQIRVLPQSGKATNIRVGLNTNSKKSLELRYNTESALTLQALEGQFERGDNQAVDLSPWQNGVHEVEIDSDFYIVAIDEVLESGPKKLEETKGTVISDYQKYLEEMWIEQLRSAFIVDINYETLDQIKTYFEKKLRSAV